MRKKTINIFIIIYVVLVVAGIVLMVIGNIGSTTVYDPVTDTNEVTSLGNPVLFYIGGAFFILWWIPFFIAWIAALISLARLQHWGWFVCMLIFSAFGLPVYLLAGPKTPKDAQQLQYQQPPQYPQPDQPRPAQKTCPNCGLQNDSGAQFCNQCGEKLQP